MTAPNEYEPSAEAVEALAKELNYAYVSGYPAGSLWEQIPDANREGYRAEARFLLRRQHAREKPLLELLRGARPTIGKTDVLINDHERVEALAAHAKLDAPKVPTLRELHAAFERHESPDTARPLLAALVKAAVEREERG